VTTKSGFRYVMWWVLF